MATKKERLNILKQWAEYFPELIPLGDQNLIKRNGAVISGICLDRTNDKKIYEAMYFMVIPTDEFCIFT